MKRLLFALCISVSASAFADVCSRSNSVVKELETVTGKPCAFIDASDLAKVTKLGMSYVSCQNAEELKSDDFLGLSSIEMIGFNYCNTIKTLPRGLFRDLSSLKMLYFNWMEDLVVPAGAFKDLASLEVLSFESTPWTMSVDDLHALKNLKSLGLINNFLISVPKDLIYSLQLESFALADEDNLTDLPESFFKGQHKLKRLYLYSNGMTTLPAKIFKDLTSLEFVNMAQTPYSILPLELFSGLCALEEVFAWDTQLSTQIKQDLQARYPKVSFQF